MGKTRKEFKELLRAESEKLLSKRYHLHRCFNAHEIVDEVQRASDSLEGAKTFDMFCKDDDGYMNEVRKLADVCAYKLYALYHG